MGPSQRTLHPLVSQAGYGPVFRINAPLHFVPFNICTLSYSTGYSWFIPCLTHKKQQEIFQG